jgi:hypothetical protein
VIEVHHIHPCGKHLRRQIGRFTVISSEIHNRRENHYEAVARRQSAGIVSAISLRSPIKDQRVT